MSSADQAVLNAGTGDTDAARTVLAHYSAADAEKTRTVLIDAFSNGMGDAYWLALGAVIIGLVVVLLIDKEKLQSMKG